jgi:putative ABC transport system permease protein
VPAADAPDPDQLTRSFHLNLAAMGLLAFVVGLFLIYNALAFSYTDRRDLLRKLRLAGVPKAELGRALLLELALFLLVGVTLGLWLGGQLAALLLPGVGQTLAQLYGVYISYPDSLVPAGFWQPLAMSAVAGMACALFPLRQALDTPLLARWSSGWELVSAGRRDQLFMACGVLLLLAAAAVAWLGNTILVALAGMACLLLGAALCLPMVLRVLLRLLAFIAPARSAAWGWLLADSRWLLSPASLALMAMTLALVANSGLNTMIGSFRQATDDWLAQRLAAELYVTDTARTSEVIALTRQLEPEATVLLRHRVALDQQAPGGQRTRVELIDLSSHPRSLDSVDLIRTVDNGAARFAAGEGMYISERAWRLDGFAPGQSVSLCPGQPSVPVLGVYHDYGNPVSQWMVSEALFQACWPRQSPLGIGIIGPPSVDFEQLRSRLTIELGLQPDQLINQQELRAVGMAVFDRTFSVTRALNLLTLIVAGIGIFCAVSAIHHHRTGQQALLASLGMPRRQRGALLLLQWGLLGLLCMALVWPFGTALAAYLAGVVTPAAFGWSFALRIEWTHYLALAGTAAGCLVAAVALPSLRLLRTPPASLLREQTL